MLFSKVEIARRANTRSNRSHRRDRGQVSMPAESVDAGSSYRTPVYETVSMAKQEAKFRFCFESGYLFHFRRNIKFELDKDVSDDNNRDNKSDGGYYDWVNNCSDDNVKQQGDDSDGSDFSNTIVGDIQPSSGTDCCHSRADNRWVYDFRRFWV